MSSTVAELLAQWRNPSEITTVLMIIGGDVVKTALAQSSGTWFTPVCFSFGWVSYIFMALIGVLGDGRLLPLPDYPVKVFNLDTGYVRENKNWVIGRIVRDHEAMIARTGQCHEGIRITLYDAKKKSTSWTGFSYDWIHIFGLLSMLTQISVASIPLLLYRHWSILLITASGTILALCHGALPQWVAEKLPNGQHTDIMFALTTGNGSKDIMVIDGLGQSLNFEEWAVTDTPRNGRPWEKFSKVYAKRNALLEAKRTELLEIPQKPRRNNTIPREAIEFRGLPLGFWVTLVTTVTQTLLWLVLLITVAAVKENTWYLLLVGAIGMFQNGIVAALERPPNTRNLPLNKRGTIVTHKVMDGLMDLEDEWSCARPLLKEFFPGDLRPDEKDWWDGNRVEYEKKRSKEARSRGIPRGEDKMFPRTEKSTYVSDREPQKSLAWYDWVYLPIIRRVRSLLKIPGIPEKLPRLDNCEPSTMTSQKREDQSFPAPTELQGPLHVSEANARVPDVIRDSNQLPPSFV